jgi:hypothetical protein
MVRVTYAGIGRGEAAMRVFDEFKPYVTTLRAMQQDCRPDSSEFLVLNIPVIGLETTAYPPWSVSMIRLPRRHAPDAPPALPHLDLARFAPRARPVQGIGVILTLRRHAVEDPAVRTDEEEPVSRHASSLRDASARVRPLRLSTTRRFSQPDGRSRGPQTGPRGPPRRRVPIRRRSTGTDRARMLVAEGDPFVRVVNDSLHARPARRNGAEQRPGEVAHQVGLAIAAAQQVGQRLGRQVANGNLPHVPSLGVGRAGVGPSTKRTAPPRSCIRRPRALGSRRADD